MKHSNRILSLFFAALLLLLPALAVAEGEQEQNAVEIISAHSKLDLAAYKGKTIILNFFTEWCPYCMQELPDFKRIYDEYSPDDLQIILVHVWDGEDASNSESIRKSKNLGDMVFFEDEDRMLSQLVGLEGYPLTIVFDKEQQVYAYQSGMVTYAQLAAAMDDLGIAKK